MSIDVEFLDAGRKAKEKPDPQFPNGTMISFAETVLQKTCTFNLPYPAPQCGSYIATCRTCGFRAAMTVAGRPDDPRVVTLPCKIGGLNS